jgi:Na+/H+-dicarboxylate symporter
MTENQPLSEQEVQKSSWYLLTGFLLGLAIGLIIAWVLLPASFTDVAPQSLSTLDKDQYRLMIARVYAVDQSLVRAQSRLELLGDDNPGEVLAAQSQQVLATGENQADAQALAALSAAVKANLHQDP